MLPVLLYFAVFVCGFYDKNVCYGWLGLLVFALFHIVGIESCIKERHAGYVTNQLNVEYSLCFYCDGKPLNAFAAGGFRRKLL